MVPWGGTDYGLPRVTGTYLEEKSLGNSLKTYRVLRNGSQRKGKSPPVRIVVVKCLTSV